MLSILSQINCRIGIAFLVLATTSVCFADEGVYADADDFEVVQKSDYSSWVSDHDLTSEPEFTFVQDQDALTARFSPMVQEQEFNVTFNPHFLHIAPALLDLVDFSYKRSKSHEAGIATTYKGWNISNFQATRGFVFGDPKAGFVAFKQSDADVLSPGLETGPVMVIVFHGSINNADWFTNYEAYKTELAQAKYSKLNLIGSAHKGFIRKYLSSSAEILSILKNTLKSLPADQRRLLKIYVTGHSQGAALAQIATAHLSQALRSTEFPELFGRDTNVEVNRINGWFLAAPAVFDEQVGKRFIEENVVGRHNMIRQNVNGDLVPVGTKILNKTLNSMRIGNDLFNYKGLGVLVIQSGLEAAWNALLLNAKSMWRHVQEGELKHAALQWTSLPTLMTTAPHYVSAGEYRGHGFTPSLVNTDAKKVTGQVYDGMSYQSRGWWQNSFDKVKGFFSSK